MIDIHSHILPGIDDGAKTEEESLLMAHAAVEEGISTIIATPHHRNESFDNYKDDIRMHVDILNDLFKANDVPLNVLYGQEVRIYGELLEDYKNGDIQTLHDTKYILIEFPFGEVPFFAEQLIYDLQKEGLQPIIAHPERNRELINNFERMYELIRQGALAQLTAASYVGHFGKEIEQFSRQLIEANLIHFIASDAHDTVKRGFHLEKAYKKIKATYGFEAYYTLLENNQLLVDNENIHRFEPEPIPLKRKRFFGLF